MLSPCFQASSHLAGWDPLSLCPHSSHPKGKSEAEQQRHGTRWVWRSSWEEAEAPALTHPCVGTGDLIYSISAGRGRWGQPEDGRKAPGPPQPRGALLPAPAVESYPGLYLLPHPHPDFAAVPEASPLTPGCGGGLRGDGAVTQQRSFPGRSGSPGPPARTPGPGRRQQRKAAEHLLIAATASRRDFCTWPSLAAAPGPVGMCSQGTGICVPLSCAPV